MKKSVVVRAGLLLIAILSGWSAQAATLQYILQSDNLSHLDAVLAQENIQILNSTKNYPARIVELEETQLQTLRTHIQGLQAHVDTQLHAAARITSNGKKGTPPPQPPEVEPWGITDIQADDARLINRGEGVIVCVVDSGIDKTHPDLVDNILGGYNFVRQGKKGNPKISDWGDTSGHGTHVAGIIAAADNDIGVVGVAPSASLYAVRVLRNDGTGNLSDVADGVLQCIQAGAHVINLSIAVQGDTEADSPLKIAVAQAVASGINVVAAAGDNSQDIFITIPAGYPGVSAVSAMDEFYTFPPSNNYGLGFDDYAAPGIGIFSTSIGGTYATLGGTSLAAAHVAGVYALMRSSGSLGIVADDIGFSYLFQGIGKVNALLTVLNQ